MLPIILIDLFVTFLLKVFFPGLMPIRSFKSLAECQWELTWERKGSCPFNLHIFTCIVSRNLQLKRIGRIVSGTVCRRFKSGKTEIAISWLKPHSFCIFTDISCIYQKVEFQLWHCSHHHVHLDSPKVLLITPKVVFLLKVQHKDSFVRDVCKRCLPGLTPLRIKGRGWEIFLKRTFFGMRNYVGDQIYG